MSTGTTARPSRPEGGAPAALSGRSIGRLEMRGLGKRFSETVALSAFDLDVHGGEFISLLGPSGCGKSTALNCLAGLVDPDAGRILLDGDDLAPVPPERRGFGVVFQSYALFPHLTVGRNVSFGLEMMGVPDEAITRRVGQVLALVHLGGLGDRYPAQLSGGQQQRVALARALVIEPRLLLMDEPLSNLDAKLRLEMRLEIRRLHQALGLTTFYVTHDQEEALSLSDRIALMKDGTIRQIGTPEEVYLHPQSAFVANFFGYRNLFPVRVEAVRGDRAQVVAAGSLRLEGRPRGELAAGAEAVAAVRPEDVRVLPPAEAAGGVPAKIEFAEFIGGAFECSVAADAGELFVVRTAARWPHGAPVVLQVDPDRLLVFPPE
ncbi:MAG TPA: ABC transporter ATP-binding protein [bacterium]|nr:ABC transporter ATP-binding protein [bacterium]